jgi:hypothetical protein
MIELLPFHDIFAKKENMECHSFYALFEKFTIEKKDDS